MAIGDFLFGGLLTRDQLLQGSSTSSCLARCKLARHSFDIRGELAESGDAGCQVFRNHASFTLTMRERESCESLAERAESARRPVSRVLYSPWRTAAIHLGLSLPAGSSGQPGAGPDSLHPLFGLAPDGVCLAPLITDGTVSSYLAFSPLLAAARLGAPWSASGMSLWHFPSGHPAPPLAGILSGGARTFLSPCSRQRQRPPSRLAV